jgi:Ca2+-binding EF-hand superfamily protein
MLTIHLCAHQDEPPEAINRYLAEFDTDHNGSIDYEEFMRMLLPKDLKYRISKLS